MLVGLLRGSECYLFREILVVGSVCVLSVKGVIHFR